MTVTLERTPAKFFDRALVETFYAIQHHRIKAANRIEAYVRLGMDQDKADTLHQFVDDNLVAMEEKLKKMIQDQVKTHPFYEYWLESVKGIGPALAGSLVACIEPISRFDNISKLWRYAGMAVMDGAAERRTKGEKIHWSPFLKTTCWKIGEQFVKQGDLYRRIYDESKAKDRQKHPEQVKSGKKSKEGKEIMLYTDMHIHNRAKRKAVKMFLSHLWLKWREMEGLPVTDPYAIAILKHGGIEKP